jgi:uncharacterized protein (DUF433 family)
MNERIAINPNVCHGRPVIKGTRVLVSTILGALSGGQTVEQILEDYPTIERTDISAALEYAGELSLFEDHVYAVAI